MSNILIFGATSRIAEMTARLFAARGDTLYLVARHEARLRAVAADLQLRGAARVEARPFEATDFSRQEAIVEDAWRSLGTVDVVLIAHGSLTDQKACRERPETIDHEMRLNASSVMCLSEHAAARLERQGQGSLVVLASVAGGRGRESNYTYGAAKAALIANCSGLRQRLAAKNVQVLTVMPGPVDSPMTAHMGKLPLLAGADVVARDIVAAIRSKRGVLYTPWFWRPIMMIIRHLPERVFCRFGPR